MKIGYLMQEGAAPVMQRPHEGTSIHVSHVYTALSNLGHDMHMLAKQGGQIWQSNDLKEYRRVSVRWLDMGPLRLFEKAVRRLQSQLALPYAAMFDSVRFAAACRQELAGCGLLYERMGWMGYGGALAARWLNIPLVLEVNGDHLAELEQLGMAPRGMQRWLSLTLVKQAARQAAHVVAAGDGWRARFIEQWKVDPGKVTTVENGSELVRLLRREQLRSFQEDSCSNDTVTLVFIGGFDPWQGLDILMNAVARTMSGALRVHLIIVGSGPRSDELKQLAIHLGIQDQVTFTGRLSAQEFAPYLAQADIGISPYCGRAEFSGLKLLDYKAAGLSIIASGKDGQPAILEHGRTGWIVPPCSVDLLLEAILRLGADIELRKKLGRAARIEAENQHSWQHTAQELNRIFTQLVAL